MELKTALDPVTLAVLRGRLEQVADEMDATLYRSAFNPIIAEAHDACHGIYDGISGDTLVQGKSGLPVLWAPWRLRCVRLPKLLPHAAACKTVTFGCSTILTKAARTPTISNWCGHFSVAANFLLFGFGSALARCGRCSAW